MKKKNLKKKLEKYLKKDGDDWIIYNDIWKQYWENKKVENYEIDVIHYEDKGFIILQIFKNKEYIVSDIKNYIKFAYVYSKYRKKGILKNMLNILFEKYKKEKFSLLSDTTTTDIIWKKVGFKCIKCDKKDRYFEFIYEN